jgi:hypothetical protein
MSGGVWGTYSVGEGVFRPLSGGQGQLVGFVGVIAVHVYSIHVYSADCRLQSTEQIHTVQIT